MSQEQKMTRQELYDEIKKSSRDGFILKEMKRLGFWDSSKPKVANELIEKKTQIQKELNKLSSNIKDPKSVIKEIHKERMKNALLRREETKAKNEEKRKKREEKKALAKIEDIGFIGTPFIQALKDKNFNEEKLKSYNLFIIKDSKDLALKMGIRLRELRFLVYSQKLSLYSNYTNFKMSKKSGGFREISAPKPLLKKLQTWILDNILNKIQIRDEANGFIKNRSIISNAKPHLNKKVVINLDFQNFFPTISYARVYGLFYSLGYSKEVATLLALISTQEEKEEITLDNQTFYLYKGKRYLPQGSPASPMITNLICRKLDSRISGIAKKFEFNYTRYADDITLSSNSYENISKILFYVKKISNEEGFNIHPNKTRVMKKGDRQEVTGVVVNEKLSINKKGLKKFRALLFQIENYGIDGKEWRGNKNIIPAIWGYANFIAMVDREKGNIYKTRVKKILEKYPLNHISPTTQKEEEKTNFIEDIVSLFNKGKK